MKNRNKIYPRKPPLKVVKSFVRKKIPLTVCIAAIYNNNAILGASDRMVTLGYGEWTYEPPVSKIIRLTNSIAVLTAGDQNIQMQVYKEVEKHVRSRIDIEPDNWWEIAEVAKLYSKCFRELKNKLLEEQVLYKYGLTLNSFIGRQKTMHDKFLDKLQGEIDTFEIGGIETIITGIDDDLGPHIYVIRNGEISCEDRSGFAAIGIGSVHAISHFMLTRYSASALESKALITIHQAKKKSEIASGVGMDTDMCVIGPLKGSFKPINEETFGIPIVKNLDNLYEKYKKAIKKADDKAESDTGVILQSLAPITSPAQSVSPSASPSASVSPSTSPSPSPEPPASESASKPRKKQGKK